MARDPVVASSPLLSWLDLGNERIKWMFSFFWSRCGAESSTLGRNMRPASLPLIQTHWNSWPWSEASSDWPVQVKRGWAPRSLPPSSRPTSTCYGVVPKVAAKYSGFSSLPAPLDQLLLPSLTVQLFQGFHTTGSDKKISRQHLPQISSSITRKMETMKRFF